MPPVRGVFQAVGLGWLGQCVQAPAGDGVPDDNRNVLICRLIEDAARGELSAVRAVLQFATRPRANRPFQGQQLLAGSSVPNLDDPGVKPRNACPVWTK